MVVGLVLAGSWASYHAPGRNDQYQLIQLGQCLFHGGSMYVDCWENKPPGIAWLNAFGLALALGNPIGPWILPGVIEAAALFVMWAALRKIAGERTTRKAILVTALVYSLRLYDTPSINPDFYASIFELAAIALLIRGVIPSLLSLPPGQVEDPPWRRGIEGGLEDVENRCTYSYSLCVLSGLLWAAATSMKQVGCVGLLVSTLCGLIAAMSRRDLRPHVLKATVSTWAGFLLGAAIVVGVLWRQGTLREAWHAIYSFNAGLVTAHDFLAAASDRARVRSELAPIVLPLWLALTGLIMSFWYRRFRGFPVSLAVGLLLWWMAAVVLAAMGPSRSMRYWQATFPPMLMLAAVGLYYIQQVQDRLVHPERLTVFIVAISAAILLAHPAVLEFRAGLATSFAASIEHPTEREQLIEIANRVRGLVGKDEPAYVLDYRPGIYVYADRPVAARFNYPRSAEQWTEILTQMESGRTKLVLVPEKPAPEFRQWCDDNCQGRLERLMSDCERAGQISDYTARLCRQPQP